VDVKTKKLVGIVSFGDESGKCAVDGVPGKIHFLSNIFSFFKTIFLHICIYRCLHSCGINKRLDRTNN